MATQTSRPRLTRTQLADVVRTGAVNRGVGRTQALELLRHRTRRDAGEELTALALNQRLAPGVRRAAVSGLYEMGGARATAALERAAASADPEVAPSIAAGLGRIGPRDDERLVMEMVSISAEHLRDHAAFGATMLAYRHGLDHGDVSIPTSRQLQDLAGDTSSYEVRFTKVTAKEWTAAQAAQKRQPVAVSLSSAAAQRIDCGSSTYIWAWTKPALTTAASSRRSARATKQVAGLLFIKNPVTDTYSVAAVGLVTPRRGGSSITVHRFGSGRILYAAALADGEVTVRSTKRPGHAAVDLKLGVRPDDAFAPHTALSSAVVRDAKHPTRG